MHSPVETRSTKRDLPNSLERGRSLRCVSRTAANKRAPTLETSPCEHSQYNIYIYIHMYTYCIYIYKHMCIHIVTIYIYIYIHVYYRDAHTYHRVLSLRTLGDLSLRALPTAHLARVGDNK